MVPRGRGNGLNRNVWLMTLRERCTFQRGIWPTWRCNTRRSAQGSGPLEAAQRASAVIAATRTVLLLRRGQVWPRCSVHIVRATSPLDSVLMLRARHSRVCSRPCVYGCFQCCRELQRCSPLGNTLSCPSVPYGEYCDRPRSKERSAASVAARPTHWTLIGNACHAPVSRGYGIAAYSGRRSAADWRAYRAAWSCARQRSTRRFWFACFEQ